MAISKRLHVEDPLEGQGAAGIEVADQEVAELEEVVEAGGPEEVEELEGV
jgi:hypothetical protein